jgi:hypothetical protein
MVITSSNILYQRGNFKDDIIELICEIATLPVHFARLYHLLRKIIVIGHRIRKKHLNGKFLKVEHLGPGKRCPY